MSFKKLLGIISVIVLVMFVLMLTTSYAWYSFESASTTFEVATNNENVTIYFQKGEYISTNVAVPITSEQVDKYSEKNNFTVKVKNNPVSNEILLTASLVNINIDEALQNANFKIDLYHQNALITSVDGNSIGIEGATSVALGSVVLDDDVDNNFELRVYILDDDSDQSAMMGKTFEAKIQLDVVSRLKTSFDTFENSDISVSAIMIDGVQSDYIPVSGNYDMSYTCTKGSILSWDSFNKVLTYESGSYANDSCALTFTSSTDYPLLNTMAVGSYVKYVGSQGKVGNKTVSCQKDGLISSVIEKAEVESLNSCNGQNAREDIDENDNTYGYCYSSDYKYYTTGWRIAYIDDNNKPVIVSAGSPECNVRTSSVANETYIQTANAKALKYCNTDYVDGNCSCIDDNNDGLCDSASSDAWAMSDTDFYYMTKAISGYGKRLTDGSSNLGDEEETLNVPLFCNAQYSSEGCGYHNDLIDNGGFYWLASQFTSSSVSGVYWDPRYRSISNTESSSYAYGLRPVISLSSSVYVTGGSGTMDDPYIIANGS